MNNLSSQFVRSVPIRYRRLATVVIIAVVAIGCMEKYGRLSMDDRVGKDFREGVMQADYNYFYSGRDTMPYAIVGIDPRFTLSSQYWIPVGSDSENLIKMSRNIFGENHRNPYGAHILASDRAVVGVWYSNLRNYSIVVDKTDRTVLILFDNPEKGRRSP